MNDQEKALMKHALNGLELTAEQTAELETWIDQNGMPAYMTGPAIVLREGGFPAFQNIFKR